MSYPFLEKKKHLFISHSSRGTLHSCGRKFEFRKMYEHPKREVGLAAELGKALHTGYQNFLVTKDEEAAIMAYMSAYPITLCDSTMDTRSLEAGYYTLMSMINATPLMAYDLAKITCPDGSIRPAIEVPFQIDLDGFSLSDTEEIKVSYTGYIDTIFFDKERNEYVVVDIKTTGRKNDDLSPLFGFDEQCLPYGLVLEYMQGRPVVGFKTEYLSCKIDILEPNVQLHSFHKDTTDIEDWFRGLLVDLSNLKMFTEMRWFPRSGGGNTCFAFNRKCEFFDICSTRDSGAIQKIIKDIDDALEGEALDEALRSKTLREQFNPWIRFSLNVPQDAIR